MKPNQKAESDEKLSQLMREWRTDILLPPRFQEQVWQRITRAEVKTELSFWQALTHWLETTFSRPAFAGAYVAILLLVGLSAGYLQAGEESAQAQSQWRKLYVQSIDPYQAPGNY